MKSNTFYLLFSLLFAFVTCNSKSKDSTFKSGDIIFQTTSSSQCKAVQLATKSKYTHVGMTYEKYGQFFVYEAVHPVSITPLDNWISHGVDGHFVVKRLKDSKDALSPLVLQKMNSIANSNLGKAYDLTFEWSDDKMYCSELVWKIYKQTTGLEVGILARLSDFDLSHEIVKQKLKERYGDQIPLNEKVISPAAMFRSDLLEVVE